MATVLSGLPVANDIEAKVKARMRELRRPPCLAVLLVGNNPASKVYVKRKHASCRQVGMGSIIHAVPEQSSEEDVLTIIEGWNEDDDVDGILVQIPLPRHIDQFKILNAINPSKDVDGFHNTNLGRLMHNRPALQPCTPMAVLELLKHYDIRTKGKLVAIVNNTIVVGQPLAAMLSSDHEMGNATTVLCHKHTRNISDILKTTDIIVSAVGRRPEFAVTKSMVRKGAVVIDVGFNRVDGRMVGDLDPDTEAGFTTPVPGGVGLVTVSVLLRNTLMAMEAKQHD